MCQSGSHLACSDYISARRFKPRIFSLLPIHRVYAYPARTIDQNNYQRFTQIYAAYPDVLLHAQHTSRLRLIFIFFLEQAC
ncbi:hypothetical protein C9I90_11865 [Photobacterium aphoticum]|uniref:Uncharacterized protein n=1 Tax=Photobacterium aphoticum TaxID=754436 RepID=A0A0J1GGJ1_9GAMM|nr:hypothetical protein ABT58_20615 [Photobacterium aphoticum]PSU56763.1 hypothetical protein C9I90_11865 [Photobacterium aphoticum]